MGVYIGQPIEVSDMKGPSPDGFHVPTKDEWVALCGILTSTFGMASNATTTRTYLKMPVTGNRVYSSAGVGAQGTYGRYWSSSRFSVDSAYNLTFSSSTLSPQNDSYRAYGFSIRCFKDHPVTPDNSWTQLYDGGDGPQGELTGIYHNATLGLISISSDGTNRTTIQDKNLGATTVYNDGDTLSEANCGKYYQRGNNYGFPRTGSVTTSSTRVDASNYGPGNYYSSDTFITYKGAWDTTDNGNLWGGVSQGTSEGVAMSELKNAYIGEMPKREPNTNTILYLSFGTGAGDLNDRSGKGNTVTQSVSGYSCLNSQGKSGCCGYFQNNANYRIQVANTSALQGGDNAYFGMFWKLDSINFQDGTCMLFAKGYDSMTNGFFLGFVPTNNNTQLQITNNRRTGMSGENRSNTNTLDPNTNAAPIIPFDTNWHHFAFSRINKFNRLYLDGQLIGQRNCSSYSFNYNNTSVLYIGAQIYGSYTQWDYPFNGRIDEFIYENRGWTQDEIQLYLSQFN